MRELENRVEEVIDLAESMYIPMFADRDSVHDAIVYAQQLAGGLSAEARTAMYTAVHVVMNTVSKEIKRILTEEEEVDNEDN